MNTFATERENVDHVETGVTSIGDQSRLRVVDGPKRGEFETKRSELLIKAKH